MQEHFTANVCLIFSTSRKSTEVNYASILVVSDTKTLLEPEILEEISKVEGMVQALTVTQDNGSQIPYSKVCTSNQGPCVSPSSHPTLVRLGKEQGPQPENHHLPHLQPSLSDRLPGQHPGRNCLRREYGAEPQSHAAAAPPEDR